MIIETIPLNRLAFAFIPAFMVIIIMIRWQLSYYRALYGMGRMLLQLLVVGFFLNTLFLSQYALLTLGILMLMMLFAGWISLSPLPEQRRTLFLPALSSVVLASSLCLIVVIFAVLNLEPWNQPRYIIPLGGMIIANAMNSISLSAERFFAELGHGKDSEQAGYQAFSAALIPNINTLFAVGIVSLPGMMTGQILSGVSPFIAARYQIMIMCIVFASSGLASANFVHRLKKRMNADKPRVNLS